MKIYYLVPDNDRPSWGVGMLYYHVWLLRKNNFEAFVVHRNKSFKITWLNISVPVVFLSDLPDLNNGDVLIIPEILANTIELIKYKCKKIVFVQNAFYIHEGLGNSHSYKDLGVSELFYYMPHLERILASNFEMPLYEIPPFTAPYYFSEKTRKEKTILVYPKFNNKEYEILMRLLRDRLNLVVKNKLLTRLTKKSSWKLKELRGLSHMEVAQEMSHAMFFISLNTTEAYNSSVPEAMASYCINLCYEGVGPRDFLINNENSFVFSNNHIFELADKLIDLIENFEMMESIIDRIAINGRNTVNQYTIEKTEQALLSYFGNLKIEEK
jgi:hypothetical protein